MIERETEGGGRVMRPAEKQEARKLWSNRRIFMVDMADNDLDEGDKVYIRSLARRLGLTGKAKRKKKPAQDAAEAVFAKDSE